MTRRNVQQRPDKEAPASLAFDSQAIHAGNVADATTGAIVTPIVMANSYGLPDDPSSLDWSDSQALFYNRNSGHNQLCLERKVAAMERAAIAHVGGAMLAIDATFTPPPMFRGLEHGADFVVHALTKYINGHGDAMGGAVAGRAELVRKLKGDALVAVGGGSISPFNAWLIMRGSVTLPLRLPRHMSSAQRIAEFLEKDPRLAFVMFPGLTSHPQHELASRQFGGRGFGAVLAFALDGGAEVQNRFVANLRLITSAVSLGHDATLIVHVGKNGRGGSEHYPDAFRAHGHLRLSVGLEDTDDLIADIRAALDITLA
jgi:methionine-gamma-lyase